MVVLWESSHFGGGFAGVVAQDFFDEEGNVCRFAIEDFSDEMNLNGFGTLDELLEPAHGVW